MPAKKKRSDNAKKKSYKRFFISRALDKTRTYPRRISKVKSTVWQMNNDTLKTLLFYRCGGVAKICDLYTVRFTNK